MADSWREVLEGAAPWVVELGDSLKVMRGMPAGCVDAIVTSPPYADQRAYEPGEIGRSAGRTANTAGNARIRARSRAQRSSAPAAWAPWLAPFTEEMLRVLSPAGSLMLNLGIVLRDGEEHDCTDEILRNCRAQGWKLLHRIVWRKPNGQVPSAAGYLTVSHEFVLWLSRTTKPWRAFEQPEGSQASKEVRTPHSGASVSRMTSMYSGAGTHRAQSNKGPRSHRLHPDGARPTTVFSCAVGGEANPDGHPARMPVLLARHLVAMTCPPGGVVLDPFAGNATTGLVAARSGRRFVGIELEPDYVEGGRRRLAEDLGLFAEVGLGV